MVATPFEQPGGATMTELKEKPQNGLPTVRGSKQNNAAKNDNSSLSYRQLISHTRRWIKTLLVCLACWELLPAALAVLLLGGMLRHD